MRIFGKKEQENAKRKFERFKSSSISQEDIDNAIKKANALGNFSKDFKLILQMVNDTLKGKFKLETHELVVFIGAIVYVACPIDALPDIIPIIGMIDDVFVVSLVLSTCRETLDRYKKFKESQFVKITD